MNNNIVESLDETPLKLVVTVPIGLLVLNHQNPRLVSADGDTVDTAIIAQLYRAEDLGELLQSIAGASSGKCC